MGDNLSNYYENENYREALPVKQYREHDNASAQESDEEAEEEIEDPGETSEVEVITYDPLPPTAEYLWLGNYKGAIRMDNDQQKHYLQPDISAQVVNYLNANFSSLDKSLLLPYFTGRRKKVTNRVQKHDAAGKSITEVHVTYKKKPNESFLRAAFVASAFAELDCIQAKEKTRTWNSKEAVSNMQTWHTILNGFAQ